MSAGAVRAADREAAGDERFRACRRWRPVQLQILVPGRLAPVRRGLVAANVPPAVITMTGIVLGGGAGAALALPRPGPAAARRWPRCWPPGSPAPTLTAGWPGTGPGHPFGAVLNEVGDRAASCRAGRLPGFRAGRAGPSGGAGGHAAVLGGAGWSGGRLGRIQGGPVGKTERCLLLALLAAIGFPLVFSGCCRRHGTDRGCPARSAGMGRKGCA